MSVLRRLYPFLRVTNNAHHGTISKMACLSKINCSSSNNKPDNQEEYLKFKDEISTTTKFVKSEMVAEFGLHVITPDMEVWNQPYDQVSEEFQSSFWHSSMPYWAIFWPGGQILSRYIIDFPNLVKNKRVVDIGAGSGAASIASIISGCDSAIANDIDEMSLGATLLNAQANNVLDSKKLQVNNYNFLQGDLDENARYLANNADILLVGDMYFDEEIGDKLSILLTKYVKCDNDANDKIRKRVLIGDPGRWYLRDKNKKRGKLKCVAKYELSDEIKRHNYGLVQGVIYEIA